MNRFAYPLLLSGLLAAGLLAAGLLAAPGYAQPLDAAKTAAAGAVADLQPEIRRMAMRLWDLSETGLHETESAAELAAVLAREGFAVERGVAGMPTAFTASYGAGRPLIGILAEYDALPGVGNAKTPQRQAREDGVTSGHGCGHNLFGAAAVGAAVALKRVMEAHGLPGTVRLYGTPAEETLIGKVYMAREGLFDDLDAALEWHPGTETGVRNQPGRAMNSFEVEFFGQAAHGSSDPWNGRSALDAVELLNHGVNLMREHIQPTARIHYVIPEGGDAPNVVPDYARAWYFVRDLDRDRVGFLYDWILQIAEGAALGTRTEHKVRLITGVHATLLNRPLQEAVYRNLVRAGPPRVSEADQRFARTLQRAVGAEEKGYVTDIEPLADAPTPVQGGSSDIAEVSRITPMGGFYVTTAAAGVPWHSWATAACHGTEAAVAGAFTAAEVLALTGVDLLLDADLRRRARAAFDEALQGQPYRSPLPAGQAPPLPTSSR